LTLAIEVTRLEAERLADLRLRDLLVRSFARGYRDVHGTDARTRPRSHIELHRGHAGRGGGLVAAKEVSCWIPGVPETPQDGVARRLHRNLVEPLAHLDRKISDDAVAPRHRVEASDREIPADDRVALLNAEDHTHRTLSDGVDACADFRPGE